MRVLCLHDECSSADDISRKLQVLATKLDQRHGIEIVYANGPLLDRKQDGREEEIRNSALSSQQRRLWFHPERTSTEETADDILPTRTTSDECSSYIGLDASILHLRQMWNQSLTNPYSGVIGFGQGATLAAAMPLISEHSLYSDMQTDGIRVRQEDHCTAESMFEGLEFVVLVHASDVLSQSSYSLPVMSSSGESHYSEAIQLSSITSSMHVFFENNGHGELLRKRYACYSKHYPTKESPHATCHRIMKSNENSTSVNQIDLQTMNAIGKYLVSTKKKLQKDQVEALRILNDTPNQETRITEHDSGPTEIYGNGNANELISAAKKIRQQLHALETEAFKLINTSIAMNPPPCLVAAVCPTSTNANHIRKENNNMQPIVAGWMGDDKDAFKSKEFKESGGAPYPSANPNNPT